MTVSNFTDTLEAFGGSAPAPQSAVKITKISGSSDSITHSINEDEKTEFTSRINQILAGDPHLGGLLPISLEGDALFDSCRNGLVLRWGNAMCSLTFSKMINHAVPRTIDERALNLSCSMNTFQMTENNNIVIQSARAIGCSVVNIGSQDIIQGRPHLVLGLVWQIIKIGLLAKVSLSHHPELFRLLKEGETLEELLKLPPEALLLRWVNHQLGRAGSSRPISNFSSDIKTSEPYVHLMHQLVPSKCTLDALSLQSAEERAQRIVENAEKIGCRNYVTASAICSGNPRLNVAFVATLFNKYPCLDPLDEQEKETVQDSLFDATGNREYRAFALWMNSLSVDPLVNNIMYDLRDGRILLQVVDKIHPGMVTPSRQNLAGRLTRFQSIENTNYALELGKKMKFSLVGIQGSDITDGNPVLTLGFVWQLMREHVLEMLRSLGADLKDADILEWANKSVSQMDGSSLLSSGALSSFKDPSVKTSFFLLDLVESLKPGSVDRECVSDASDEEKRILNAMYLISVARKMGACIFLLPEDIVEAKGKMIMTLVGSLMALSK